MELKVSVYLFFNAYQFYVKNKQAWSKWNNSSTTFSKCYKALQWERSFDSKELQILRSFTHLTHTI